MKKLLGCKDGKKVYGMYSACAGSLPTLRITGREWRGSSLGPANPNATPSAGDIEYWRSIAKTAKLID